MLIKELCTNYVLQASSRSSRDDARLLTGFKRTGDEKTRAGRAKIIHHWMERNRSSLKPEGRAQ
jgi:hypothetical protein